MKYECHVSWEIGINGSLFCVSVINDIHALFTFQTGRRSVVETHMPSKYPTLPAEVIDTSYDIVRCNAARANINGTCDVYVIMHVTNSTSLGCFLMMIFNENSFSFNFA